MGGKIQDFLHNTTLEISLLGALTDLVEDKLISRTLTGNALAHIWLFHPFGQVVHLQYKLGLYGQ